MKRIVSLVLLIILIFSTGTSNLTYADKDDLYLSSGKILQTLGVLEGTETGDLKLKNNLVFIFGLLFFGGRGININFKNK